MLNLNFGDNVCCAYRVCVCWSGDSVSRCALFSFVGIEVKADIR